MRLVRSESLGENKVSLILLENADEQSQWNDVIPRFAKRGMIITNICLKSSSDDQIGILKILHRSSPSSLMNFLRSTFNAHDNNRDQKLGMITPHSDEHYTNLLQKQVFNHCTHLEYAKLMFILVPITTTRDEWLIIPKDHDNTYQVKFLDEKGLFIEELTHRIRRTLHLQQLSYNACKNVQPVSPLQLPEEKNNLFSTGYPRDTLDLESILQLISEYHEILGQFIDFKELFMMLGKMQFYCYWLGHYNLNESVVISFNPLKGSFTQLNTFYPPLSNAILLNTYQSIDSTLKSERKHLMPNSDELWDEFRKGMHIEAIHLQRLLEDEDTKKEMIFLLKAYQRLLRFPSSDLERMFQPSTWFRVF